MHPEIRDEREGIGCQAEPIHDVEGAHGATHGASFDKKRTALTEQLARLRQQRVQRPRLLCSLSVSSRTGQGLHEARRVLTALMEDTRLFPHVGMSVPLNYSMLERLAQQGSVQATRGAEAGSSV